MGGVSDPASYTPSLLTPPALRSNIETAKLGLIMVILSFIFMKGNSVKDSKDTPNPTPTPLCPHPHPDTPFVYFFLGAVWEFLRRLHVVPG